MATHPQRARTMTATSTGCGYNMDSRALLVVIMLGTTTVHAADLVVRVHTPDGEELSNAVIMVDANPQTRSQHERSTAVVDQVNRAFVPHVSVVRAGTLVSFPNSDDIRHHVYSFSDAKTFELPLYQGTPSESVEFDKTGIVTLACNIHDWMLAFVYVTDAEWFAVTGDDGIATFQLPDHEAYTITVWHPNIGMTSSGLTLQIPHEARMDVTVELAASEGRGLRRLRRGSGRYR